MWQCYGGREIDQEYYTVRNMFGYSFVREGKGQPPGYRRALPSRDLELLYNEGLSDGGSPTSGLQQRHRWLHWWYWSYTNSTNTARVFDYFGPD